MIQELIEVYHVKDHSQLTRSLLVLRSPSRAPVTGLVEDIAAGAGAGIGATTWRIRHLSVAGPLAPALMEF